ncbi:MAG: hypothetical protein ACI4K7_12535 [Oscillospiraceae bacterium]
MTIEEAIEIVTNAVQTENMTAEQDRALAIVQKAAGKQVPKKSVSYDSVPHSRCPVCHNAVKVFEDAHEYHHCLYCGQKLDWSDVE